MSSRLVTFRRASILAAAAGAVACAPLPAPPVAPVAAAAPAPTPAPPSQNPSPMVETTRAHERLTRRRLSGTAREFIGPAGRPVELFVPEGTGSREAPDLLIHFHGAAWLVQQ